MESVNVTIRMDKNLKVQSEALFKELGLSMNAAFTIFAKQAVREQKIPFEISKKSDISFASRNQLNEAFDKEMDKRLEVYQELAKWFGWPKRM